METERDFRKLRALERLADVQEHIAMNQIAKELRIRNAVMNFKHHRLECPTCEMLKKALNEKA